MIRQKVVPKEIWSKKVNEAVAIAGSIVQLAVEAKINRTSIYEWLRGSKTPSLSSIAKIDAFLARVHASEEREYGGKIYTIPKVGSRAVIRAQDREIERLKEKIRNLEAAIEEMMIEKDYPALEFLDLDGAMK